MPVQQTVYLEEDLFLRIVQRKRASRRSLSKEINAMLAALLEREAHETDESPSKGA